MRYTKTVRYLLLAVLFVLTLPCAAEAASIMIQPHQFKPVDPSNLDNYQEPAHIWTGTGGAAAYYAVLNLPVGRTITAVVVYHRGTSSGGTKVELYRTKFRERAEQMSYFYTSAPTSGAVIKLTTGNIFKPLVKAGYTYHVQVTVYSGNYIHGVKVKYE